MTGQDLSPLIEEAIREIAHLTAASASLDEQVAQVRQIVVAYGTVLFNAHPKLGAICETVYPEPSIDGRGKPTPYYLLSDKDNPVYWPLIGHQLNEGYAIGVVMKLFPEHRLSSTHSDIVSVHYRKWGDPNARVTADSDKRLLLAFPAIVRSISYLKDRMRGADDDLEQLWQELRACVLAE